MKHIIIFLLASLVLFGGCFDSDEYTPDQFLNNPPITFIGSLNYSVLADGATTVRLTVEISKEASADTKILFTTTSGSFKLNGNDSLLTTTHLSQNNEKWVRVAYVELLVPLTTGTATVRTFANGIEASDQVAINFEKAIPESLDINVDSFKLTAGLGSEVNISVQLRRIKGLPSIGSEVVFVAIDSSNVNIGAFRNILKKSDEQGRASVTFALPDTSYIGPVKLKAIALDQQSLSDSITVYSIK